jgi:dTDP-4-dehydrorhamnose reductase
VRKIIAQLQEPEIRAIDDCLDTPTYAKDLMQTIKKLMREGRTGIVHLTNSGVASRFLQAKYIADFFGYRGRLVPVSLNDFHLTPPPLKNEALVSKTIHLRPWQDALREYLKTEWR